MIPVATTELVVERQAGATVISYHQGICKAAELNDVGYGVWKLIDGCRTTSEIAALLTTAFPPTPDVTAESIAADVAEFLLALEREGFVRPIAVASVE